MSEPPYQPPLADWNAAWPEITVRMSPMVADSLAETRALSKLGIAMAAMMPMIATTISSSIRVKPFCLFIEFNLSFRQGTTLATLAKSKRNASGVLMLSSRLITLYL